MHSLRLRLILIFVLLVTLTLGGFGVYTHVRLSNELENDFVAHQQKVLARLRVALVPGLWNMDEQAAERIIQAELQVPEVSAIMVIAANAYDRNATFAAANKKVVAASVPRFLQNKALFQERIAIYAENGVAPLEKDQQGLKPIGTVEVIFSHAVIDAKLYANILHTLQQIIVLNLFLLCALILSLRMVFLPIKQLTLALKELASQDAESAQELPLSKNREFSEVIQQFNSVLHNLKNVIARQRTAEQATSVAMQQVQDAYTTLEKTQESLVQSEKLASLGGLVAGIAHEINTPVGVIVTSASVLSYASDEMGNKMHEGAMRKSDMLNYLSVASESARLIAINANRAAQLIQSFKQVAVDQTSEQRREFALQAFLEDVIASLRPTLKKARTTIAVEMAQVIHCDSYPGLLGQVITNLAMNSMHHAFAEGEEGHIFIHASAADGQLLLEFRDDGRGIPTEDLNKVFDPFFTTRRAHGGTGLGLNIVFNIISQQFGGTITAGNHPSGGAVFTICVPLLCEHRAVIKNP